MTNLHQIDWRKLPSPRDDGGAAHLTGMKFSPVALSATDGTRVNLHELAGRYVVYAYPMTGRPDVALPENWDMIPGARGCTPQSCAFRDHTADLAKAGISAVFGLSTQTTDYQREALERLHLPFALLSDHSLELTRAMKLPTFDVDGMTLLRRLTVIVRDGVIEQVFYPVFPPDRNAQDVIDWVKAHPA
jgi:peroxiredoxin